MRLDERAAAFFVSPHSPDCFGRESSMNYRNCIATVWMIAAILQAGVVPAFAITAEVACETFNPCTEGVCLENGTCEASPANNGESCDTFDPCKVGVCSGGNCVQSDAGDGTSCVTADACKQKNGQCSDGVCEAPVLANGATCRADVMGPCVTGTCTTIETFSFCNPVFPCGQPDACDLHCNPESGECESFPTNICDDPCRTGTCEVDGEFGYTCTNVTNHPNQSDCVAAGVCNGKCQTGECMGSGSSGGACGDGSMDESEECDDGDTDFATGEACDGECQLVPCGRPTNSAGATPKASDALFALRTAVNLVSCALVVCDVNDSGMVTASDALFILRKAVGGTVALVCPTS
jgi:hypothetical protein